MAAFFMRRFTLSYIFGLTLIAAMVPRLINYEGKKQMLNIKHEILIETYRPWVKKLGQWHLSNDDGKTRCGVPMLGNNYAKYIPENERTKCEKCFK